MHDPVADENLRQNLLDIKGKLTSEQPVTNWRDVLDGAVYEYPDRLQIEAVVLDNIRKKYIGKGRMGTEIVKPQDEKFFKGEGNRRITTEDFKEGIISVAKGLIEENSLDISKTSKLYDALMDHVSKKFFHGFNISEVSQDELETAYYFLPTIEEKFTRGIIMGVIMEAIK